MDAFFLHYAPAGDFDDGIFVPYASALEAERQASNDLMHGADPEQILGIFRAPYALPKFGWKRADKEQRADLLLPHLVADKRVHVASIKDIVKVAGKHQDAIMREAVEGSMAHLMGIHEDVRRRAGLPDATAYAPGNAYVVHTGSLSLTNTPVALAAATAKTVLYILAGTANAFSVCTVTLSFDGATASATPVLVEFMYGTAASNSAPGTGSTASTPKQVRGVTSTSGHTAAYNCTSEPTVYEPVHKQYLHPYGGLDRIQVPLGRENTSAVAAATTGKVFAVRLTAPAIVNAHATIEYEE